MHVLATRALPPVSPAAPRPFSCVRASSQAVVSRGPAQPVPWPSGRRTFSCARSSSQVFVSRAHWFPSGPRPALPPLSPSGRTFSCGRAFSQAVVTRTREVASLAPARVLLLLVVQSASPLSAGRAAGQTWAVRPAPRPWVLYPLAPPSGPVAWSRVPRPAAAQLSVRRVACRPSAVRPVLRPWVPQPVALSSGQTCPGAVPARVPVQARASLSAELSPRDQAWEGAPGRPASSLLAPLWGARGCR